MFGETFDNGDKHIQDAVELSNLNQSLRSDFNNFNSFCKNERSRCGVKEYKRAKKKQAGTFGTSELHC
jgi:hypothetical protein